MRDTLIDPPETLLLYEPTRADDTGTCSGKNPTCDDMLANMPTGTKKPSEEIEGKVSQAAAMFERYESCRFGINAYPPIADRTPTIRLALRSQRGRAQESAIIGPLVCPLF
jgi:hypothetical protein